MIQTDHHPALLKHLNGPSLDDYENAVRQVMADESTDANLVRALADIGRERERRRQLGAAS